jgi:hypothetical protein
VSVEICLYFCFGALRGRNRDTHGMDFALDLAQFVRLKRLGVK